MDIDYENIAKVLRLTDDSGVMSITNLSVIGLLAKVIHEPSASALGCFAVAVGMYLAKKALAAWSESRPKPAPVDHAAKVHDEKLTGFTGELQSLKKDLDSLKSALALKSAFTK